MPEDREPRLDTLQQQARAGRVFESGATIADAPLPTGDYYGRPALKPPVWTWEIPVYLFVGGVAGMASLIATVGLVSGAAGGLIVTAHMIAVVGAVISPVLLISDLGRPARFLYMLRVFKLRSPMSVGAWTLALFGGAATTCVVLDVTGAPPVVVVAVNVAAASLGVLLATYTGVLLGVTAIPIWARHAALLPVHFAASSLGAAASMIELAGRGDAALHTIALASAIAESVIAVVLTLRSAGATGWAIRLGELGSGIAPLVLRTVAAGVPGARVAAGMCAVAGSLLTRIGWIAAGRASINEGTAA